MWWPTCPRLSRTTAQSLATPTRPIWQRRSARLGSPHIAGRTQSPSRSSKHTGSRPAPCWKAATPHPRSSISPRSPPAAGFGLAGWSSSAASPTRSACASGTPSPSTAVPTGLRGSPSLSQYQPGLIWLSRSDAMSLATPDVGISYLLNLKLANPAQAPAFAASYTHTPPSGPALVVNSWQNISTDAAKLVRGPRTVLLVGSGLLVALALASVAVLVGGRLSEQTRRIGLLKAVGATPGTVAAVLLVEHVAVTLIAAAAGLAIGRGLAPLLTSPGAGLPGAAGSPPVTAPTIVT